VTAVVVPVIIGATGTISKSFRKYLGNIPEKAPIQGTTIKTAILGTATHTRTAGSTDVKVQNAGNMGNNITCSTDSKYSVAETPYTYKLGLFRVYEPCPKSKDTSRVGRYGKFFMLIVATLPSTLSLYL